MSTRIRHTLALTIIERTRQLPIPGEVLMRTGQKVRANEIVATAITEPKHILINIAGGLGIQESKVQQCLERDVGDVVEAGDIIASRSNFGKRVIRAPANGVISFISGGYVFLQVNTKPFQLKSGTPGSISNLITDYGVLIEATGALVQGVWGNGLIDFGLMNVLTEAPDQSLTPAKIDVGMRGGIVMGGTCQDGETLQNGSEQRLKGMILGSLSVDLVETALKMPYPIILIDGLGSMPMNEPAFKLLSTNAKREVAINAEAFDPVHGIRPEVMIPLPGSDQLDYPLESEELVVGQKVLITRAPHQGRAGMIENILPGIDNFPSGLRTQAAIVRLSKEKVVKVPTANLEILA